MIKRIEIWEGPKFVNWNLEEFITAQTIDGSAIRPIRWRRPRPMRPRSAALPSPMTVKAARACRLSMARTAPRA